MAADRRGFFKELLREVAGVAQELSSAMRDVDEQVFAEAEPEDWTQARVRAVPARGSVGAEELLALCREAGLKQRAADVERRSRASIRLTRVPEEGAAAGASRLGGSPDVPPGFAWPTWEDRELAFVGQLDLAQIAAVDPDLPLPPEGRLLFFYDLDRRPAGLNPAHRGSCRVVHLDARFDGLAPDERRTPALQELALELSRELMLPGAWSFLCEELELSPEEMDAWDELRERLAGAQGVELEETSADFFALHRLLGYHEEIGREIEVECELAAAGLEADDVSVYYDKRLEHEAAARTWRLLLQLTVDDDLGIPADAGFERLYICIRDADLRSGDFGAAWAILR
jgi:uncharacterized protein YwqG